MVLEKQRKEVVGREICKEIRRKLVKMREEVSQKMNLGGSSRKITA